MSFTEFYCRTDGSSLNGGSSDAAAAAYTSTNGNWNGSSTFTPTDGSTPASTIAVDDWVSVYNDGATTGVYWARVTNVAAGVNGVITVSTTNKFGNAPTSSATARSLKAKGSWKGPTTGSNHPFQTTGFGPALVNAAGDATRINMKAGTYSPNGQITLNNGGPMAIQGFTTNAGDGGRATIDGGSNNILLWSSGNNRTTYRDLIFSNNGTSTNNLVTVTGARNQFIRCVFHDAAVDGLALSGGMNEVIECEFYLCNKQNSANKGGCEVSGTQGNVFKRCIFHDNAGSNTSGAIVNCGAAHFESCIFDTNGVHGIAVNTANIDVTVLNCDFYNNASSGIAWTAAASSGALASIENCSFVKNGAYGVDGSTGGSAMSVYMRNTGWGGATGSNQNVTANTRWVAGTCVSEDNSVTYTSHPWYAPTTGDFRLVSSEALGAGRGAFTQTQSSYTGAAQYASIGACNGASPPVTNDGTLGGNSGGGWCAANYISGDTPVDWTVTCTGLPTGVVTQHVTNASYSAWLVGFARTTVGAGTFDTYLFWIGAGKMQLTIYDSLGPSVACYLSLSISTAVTHTLDKFSGGRTVGDSGLPATVTVAPGTGGSCSTASQLARPTNVAAVASGSNVVVTWTNNEPSHECEVWRATSTTDHWAGWTKLTTTAAGATSYTDTSAAPGTAYRYMVLSANPGTGDRSGWGNIAGQSTNDQPNATAVTATVSAAPAAAFVPVFRVLQSPSRRPAFGSTSEIKTAPLASGGGGSGLTFRPSLTAMQTPGRHRR